MTHPAKRVEEIRDRLAKATPGPWEKEGKDFDFVVRTETNKYLKGYGIRCGEKDADLIANAPQDLAYLLERCEKMREALKFYADTRSWQDTNGDDSWDSPTHCDNGDCAREALKESDEK